MKKISDYFGCMVFNDSVMRERLAPDVYEKLKKTIDEGARLDSNVASAVAEAMKEWAIELGATHFTHWFQPLTGITAEKHDSFIAAAPGGRVIMEFSGKELIKGEPDASSFPSGGLRATFEARGYTAWDPTSYAFIKDNTLCIPTAFCSFGGEALDKKTPLLRSMEALNVQALRILRLFGNTTSKYVHSSSGAEQEYFLIDRRLYNKRPDLKFTGRTLFGAKAPKGQELNDHYFGAIKPRVAAYMAELDEELWKLGVLAKTEHNEVAPGQHELAPIYSTTNIATDHNQLTMEVMQNVAARHDLVCLLHEKPFEGVNGSGKHNNWSIDTDDGIHLLKPGASPHDNAQFLLFLVAVIQAVDDYQDLLRVSVATAGNDHRLGSHEAPPAIISVFLGNELTSILESIENDAPYSAAGRREMAFGVPTLPAFFSDTTDRNRTSPFAFTGNKFEFRMLGSSNSIACANIMLNAAVAESLRQYADRLEKAQDFNAELHAVLKEAIIAHKRIIFNGNGYSEEWVAEAKRRGLSNLPTTPDCLPKMLDPKNVAMLTSHKVFTEMEIRSRYEILLGNYVNIVGIEAATMLDMAQRDILPAVSGFSSELAERALIKAQTGIDNAYEQKTASELSKLETAILDGIVKLREAYEFASGAPDITEHSIRIRNCVLPAMSALRAAADKAETLTDNRRWPLPTYAQLMFGV
ncbi:MAG: glutamine synthetase III [Clostridia bacterium]|nr:glutamine synthetase III [Clostridia bacterium]MBP5781452.1 glutamine synthetase III [Clostridia bacterium]